MTLKEEILKIDEQAGEDDEKYAKLIEEAKVQEFVMEEESTLEELVEFMFPGEEGDSPKFEFYNDQETGTLFLREKKSTIF